MDVSYSAWRQSAKESLALKAESFSFLFERRYTIRLNRMSRVFFDAYVRATNELAAQEDRFPSLSEIDAKMESGAVYAFKDRLTKNTEFFDEVKISGVSYLVPRAKRFVDASGTYTELAFDFDLPTMILPSRRKTSSLVEPASPEAEKADLTEEAEMKVEEERAEPSVEKSLPDGLPEEIGRLEELPADVIAQPPKKVESRNADKGANINIGRNIRIVAIGLVALAIALAAGAYVIGLFPAESPKLVQYSTFLSNVTLGNYLGVDIKNRDGIGNEVEMTFPPNIDRSISSRGGVITISHSGNTFIRLNSSSDASVRLYLSSNWTAIPVVLNLAVPKGYDSGLIVHAKDYNVLRNDDRIILRFNCTHEGISFEQSYTPRR